MRIYQDETAKETEDAIYGEAVSFGGGSSSSGALQAGSGESGSSYSSYSSSSRNKKSSRKSSRRSSGSSQSTASAIQKQLKAEYALNLVNGQFDSSGYVSRVQNLMNNLGIADPNNAQVRDLINSLGGLTAAQKQEIYTGVGGTVKTTFDDGLQTGSGGKSLLNSLNSGDYNYLPRGDEDDSLLRRLGRMKYAT